MHLDWRFDNPFTREFTVSAGYIDALGHTNNTIYSQWCEETAWAHSAALGMDAAGYQRLDRAMAIQRAEYDYLLPSFTGETLLVGTWLTAMRRSSPWSAASRFLIAKLAACCYRANGSLSVSG